MSDNRSRWKHWACVLNMYNVSCSHNKIYRSCRSIRQWHLRLRSVLPPARNTPSWHPRSNFLMDQGTFSEIWSDNTVKYIEDMGLWSLLNREPHQSSSLKACILGWHPCSSQHQQCQEVAPVIFTSATTLFHSPSSNWSRNSTLDWLTSPSALPISSAIRNQNECKNGLVYMWHLGC